MHLKSLTPYIYQIVFPLTHTVDDVESQDIRITICEDTGEAVVIDTGFLEQGAAARQFLLELNIDLSAVIVSHYHPDHAAGATAFEGCRVLAHPAYRRSYEFYKKIYPEQRYIEPTEIVEEGTIIRVGNCEIHLLETPGHSPCSLTAVINNEVIHVGDLVQAVGDRPGVPFLPSGSDIQAYIESLERVRHLEMETLVPSHGNPIRGQGAIHRAIDGSIHYLNRLVETGGDAPLKDLLVGDPTDYSCLGFHTKNLKRLKKGLEV